MSGKAMQTTRPSRTTEAVPYHSGIEGQATTDLERSKKFAVGEEREMRDDCGSNKSTAEMTCGQFISHR